MSKRTFLLVPYMIRYSVDFSTGFLLLGAIERSIVWQKWSWPKSMLNWDRLEDAIGHVPFKLDLLRKIKHQSYLLLKSKKTVRWCNFHVQIRRWQTRARQNRDKQSLEVSTMSTLPPSIFYSPCTTKAIKMHSFMIIRIKNDADAVKISNSNVNKVNDIYSLLQLPISKKRTLQSWKLKVF